MLKINFEVLVEREIKTFHLQPRRWNLARQQQKNSKRWNVGIVFRSSAFAQAFVCDVRKGANGLTFKDTHHTFTSFEILGTHNTWKVSFVHALSTHWQQYFLTF